MENNWMNIISKEYPNAYEHTIKQLANSGSQTLERLYYLNNQPIEVLRKAFKELEIKLRNETLNNNIT